MSPPMTIFNHLDTPPRILIWAVGDVVTVMGPVFLCLVCGQIMMAMVMGVAIVLMMRFFKKNVGVGFLRGVSFWMLPHSTEKYPVTPPSYIREFIQ